MVSLKKPYLVAMGLIMNKAIFLDRDGTINVEVNFLHECDKVAFIDGVVEALRILKSMGYKLIVISNQSGVGRGYFTINDVNEVNQYINDSLTKLGAGLDAFYVCPHAPSDSCRCRKPGLALYLEAIKDFDIDVAQSFLVGDKESDILAADELGCRYGLLLSGHDIDESIKKKYAGFIFDNLLEFARSIKE